MRTVKIPEKEVKVCFDVQQINSLLARIDNDPDVGPKGIAQIQFYGELTAVLQHGGKVMEITIEKETSIPDECPTPPDVVGDGTVVWQPDNAEECGDSEPV